jgi:hypothetical protein
MRQTLDSMRKLTEKGLFATGRAAGEVEMSSAASPICIKEPAKVDVTENLTRPADSTGVDLCARDRCGDPGRPA